MPRYSSGPRTAPRSSTNPNPNPNPNPYLYPYPNPYPNPYPYPHPCPYPHPHPNPSPTPYPNPHSHPHPNQVLSRTVRGMMRYGDGLRVLARLEGVPEEDIEMARDSAV